MKILELENEPLAKLRKVAKALNVPNSNRLKKEALILQLRQTEAQKEGVELRGGILEIMSEGIGFLRAASDSLASTTVKSRALPLIPTSVTKPGILKTLPAAGSDSSTIDHPVATTRPGSTVRSSTSSTPSGSSSMFATATLLTDAGSVTLTREACLPAS